MTTGQPWDACMTTGFGLSSASGGYEPTPAAHARIVEALVRELDLPKFTIVAHFPREHCPETIVRIMQLWLQRAHPGRRHGSLVEPSRGGPGFTGPGVTVS